MGGVSSKPVERKASVKSNQLPIKSKQALKLPNSFNISKELSDIKDIGYGAIQNIWASNHFAIYKTRNTALYVFNKRTRQLHTITIDTIDQITLVTETRLLIITPVKKEVYPVKMVPQLRLIDLETLREYVATLDLGDTEPSYFPIFIPQPYYQIFPIQKENSLWIKFGVTHCIQKALSISGLINLKPIETDHLTSGDLEVKIYPIDSQNMSDSVPSPTHFFRYGKNSVLFLRKIEGVKVQLFTAKLQFKDNSVVFEEEKVVHQFPSLQGLYCALFPSPNNRNLVVSLSALQKGIMQPWGYQFFTNTAEDHWEEIPVSHEINKLLKKLFYGFVMWYANNYQVAFCFKYYATDMGYIYNENRVYQCDVDKEVKLVANYQFPKPREPIDLSTKLHFLPFGSAVLTADVTQDISTFSISNKKESSPQYLHQCLLSFLNKETANIVVSYADTGINFGMFSLKKSNSNEDKTHGFSQAPKKEL